jgi:hypothetical protein
VGIGVAAVKMVETAGGIVVELGLRISVGVETVDIAGVGVANIHPALKRIVVIATNIISNQLVKPRRVFFRDCIALTSSLMLKNCDLRTSVDRLWV